MGKKIFFLIIAFSVSLSIKAQPTQDCNKKVTSKILIIGDSWGQFMFLYHGYREALRQYGFADITELGGSTTIIGAQTSTWTRGLGKMNIKRQLLQHPEIEDVVLMLGGNDFVWDYDYGDPIEVLDNSIARTNLGMDTVVTLIRSIRPDVRIILPSYDYPNFIDPLIDLPWNPYYDSWESFGFPNPYEANTSMQYIETKREAWSHTHSNMAYVQNLGLMQYHFGQKDTLKDTSPLGYFYPRLPPYDPKSVPFPYGNPMYPTPQVAMGLFGFDAYHLGPEGFKVFAANQIKHVLLDKLRGFPTATFYSDSENDGWVNSLGKFASGEIKVGKGSSTEEVKGLLSFNTENIPDDAIISDASIFITRKKLEGRNPLNDIFPSNANLDIKKGTINGILPEGIDFAAQMDYENAGCFVGQSSHDGYTTRIDLKPEALLFLNKEGITQFRVAYNSGVVGKSSLVSYYTGGEIDPDEPVAAHLDVHYTSQQSENKKIENAANFTIIYPNPANNEITIKSAKKIETIIISDVLGRQQTLNVLELYNSINLEKFSKGLLLISINYADGTFENKKIVRE